jgi:hypothetical protein
LKSHNIKPVVVKQNENSWGDEEGDYKSVTVESPKYRPNPIKNITIQKVSGPKKADSRNEANKNISSNFSDTWD